MLLVKKIEIIKAYLGSNLMVNSIEIKPNRLYYIISDFENLRNNFKYAFINNLNYPSLIKVNNISILDFDPSRFGMLDFETFFNNNDLKNVTQFISQSIFKNKKIKSVFLQSQELINFQINELILKSNGASEEELRNYSIKFTKYMDPLFHHLEEVYSRHNYIFDDYDFTSRYYLFAKQNKGIKLYQSDNLDTLKLSIKKYRNTLLKSELLLSQRNQINHAKLNYKKIEAELLDMEKVLFSKYGHNFNKDKGNIELLTALENKIVNWKEYRESLINEYFKINKLESLESTKISNLTFAQKLKIFLTFSLLSFSQILFIPTLNKELINDEERNSISNLLKSVSNNSTIFIESKNLSDVLADQFSIINISENGIQTQFDATRNSVAIDNKTINLWKDLEWK
ncbi:hypothetical protein EI74_0539 [Mycoplasma testudineum]|uniref:Uncharacterized protein n=1 Tax=Mycoplasma testudineum TaxID=244584 RepID=A0A4R6ICC5_9MOLU|nr:hypothetical protein [Mycoplasma testudineum]OYD26764.1 hypothetical protein CG473_02300 [Mycoplasma testudineum]TDO19900.1 hypothetical protein EI74_0539 [Mycoplasma testudineum]